MQHQKQDCFTLEHGTDRLTRNVGKYQPTQRNIPESKDLIYGATVASNHAK
jgi:hypothetical protein